MKPKLITTNVSFAIISGILKEYNRQNIKEYLEKCFEIINDKDVSVSSVHLLRGKEYFIEKSQWLHRIKALKKAVLKSLGRLVVCTDFSIVKTIVKLVYYVFSSQCITDKYIKQLRIFEKAINQYNEGSLDAEYVVCDDITETPDMQQQSDDVMKANSKTAEENMGITCRIPSFWNEFLQQEHIYNESKEKQRISIVVLILQIG